MTTHEFALSDLAARLAGTDAILSTSLRDILTVALPELIEAELTATIGAAPGERTTDRVAQRNGHRPKLLSTPGGDVEIGIPKLRQGSFFPELLEPRRRIDKALWAVIMTAYITGTSTRKVDDLVKALGCDSGISKSTVSRICTQIDADVHVPGLDDAVLASADIIIMLGDDLAGAPWETKGTPLIDQGIGTLLVVDATTTAAGHDRAEQRAQQLRTDGVDVADVVISTRPVEASMLMPTGESTPWAFAVAALASIGGFDTWDATLVADPRPAGVVAVLLIADE